MTQKFKVEFLCPMTDEFIDGSQCKNCKAGAWYGCPVKQELAEMEGYQREVS